LLLCVAVGGGACAIGLATAGGGLIVAAGRSWAGG
jgi:hypothetical protein